ncbi:hypothetical protein QUB36_29635 [Microcoleus sp. AT8-B1]|uniref:hypothetical protein n=1 Tax=unclassified Microcoleus TaxID=2642155 RepID=UPI002FD00DA0
MHQKVVDIVTAQNLLPSQGDLVAKFSKIDLPKTIEMGDRAKVNVKLTNQGSAPVTGPVTVKLYTSTDETIDRAPDGKLVNDCLLTSTIQQVNLLPGQFTTVRLNYGNMTSVGAPGACNLIAEINQNNNFGENYSFTAVSQEMPGVTRTYNSFYDAAYEDAISRVYGGVHVREATIDDALPTGLAVGNFVAQNLFKTVV